MILKSTDGGANWNYVSSPAAIALNGLAFSSATTGYAVGKGPVLKTTDGGDTLGTQTADAVLHTDTQNAVAVDGNGDPWVSGTAGRSTLAAPTAVGDKTRSRPVSPSIRTIRIRDSLPTSVRFMLPHAAKVNLVIYNMLGQRVATPVAGTMFEAGSHTVQFDARGLCHGHLSLSVDRRDVHRNPQDGPRQVGVRFTISGRWARRHDRRAPLGKSGASCAIRSPGVLLMMKHNIALAAVCLVVSFGIAAPASYQEGRVYRHQLDNGLVILTMERHIARSSIISSTYRVGSRNERLGITGISHVVEHMMFKGTPKYGKGKASRAITDNAGVFDAFTANDMTSYFEYLPANRISLAMEIRIRPDAENASFDSAEFISELEVIKQERRMRTESSAQGVMAEAMNSVAYQSHPNRDPIIGWPADLGRMTRADAFHVLPDLLYTEQCLPRPCRRFRYRRHRGHGEEILRQGAARSCGPGMWGVDQPQRVRKTFHPPASRDVASPSFRMAFHVPTYADTDAAPLRLAGMILCERSRDARLHKRRLHRTGEDRHGCGRGHGDVEGSRTVLISVSVVPDSSVERAEAMVWEEIERMQREPVHDRELQKVKNRYRFTQVTEYVEELDIGTRLSRYEAFYGWDMFDVFDARVKGVTAAQIQDVMTNYFRRDQVTVGYLQPETPRGKKSARKAAAEGEDAPDASAPDPGWQEVSELPQPSARSKA